MRPNGWLAISYLLATIVAQGVHHHHHTTAAGCDASGRPEVRQAAQEAHDPEAADCPSCDFRGQAGSSPVAPPPSRPGPVRVAGVAPAPSPHAGPELGFRGRAPPAS